MTQLGEAVVPIRATMEKLDKDLAASRSKIDGVMGQAAGKAQALGAAAVAGIGVAVAAGAAAIAKFVLESVEKFQKFQQGMSEVFTLLPGITEQAMGKMDADVLRFGASVGRLSSETVPALYQSLSAGVPPSNVFDFMQVASDAALGGVTSLETAVDTLSTVVNAYGAENISAQEASDLLFTAVKGGKTTFDELGASLFNVIPTAASLGVEFGNITAAIATMTAQGTPTAQATTQLRQLLIELSKAGSDAADTFERVAGKSFVDFIAQGGNLQQALQLMEQAAGQSNLRLSDLFSSVEAGNAALTLTGAGTAKFTAELANAEDAAGATAAAADIMADSQEHLDARIAATTEQIQIMIGQGLTPGISKFKEIKLTILEAAAALLTYGQRTREIIQDNQAWSGSLEGLIEEGKEITDVLNNLNSVQSFASNMFGTSEAMRERLVEIAQELHGVSDSWDDYISNIKAATGATEVYVGATGMLGVTLADGQQYIIGNAQALVESIGVYEGSWQVVNDYNQEILNQTSLTNQLIPATQAATEAMMAQRMEMAEASLASSTLGDKRAQMAGFISEEEGRLRGLNQQLDREFLAQQQAAAATAEHEAAIAAVNARLSDYFVGALPAIEATGSLEEQLFNATAAVGGLPGPLAEAAAASGLFSQEQITTATNAAIFEEAMGRMAAAVASGAVPYADAIAALTDLKAELANPPPPLVIETNVEEATAGLTNAQIVLSEKLGVFTEESQGMSTDATSAFGEIASAATSNMPTVEQAITDAITNSSAVIATELPAMSAQVGTDMTTMSGDVDTAMSAMETTTDTTITTMVGSFETGMGEIVSVVGVGLENAKVTASGYVAEFQGVGYDVTAGMAAGVSSGEGVLVAAVRAVVQAALAAAADEAGTASPSWKTEAIFTDFVAGGVVALDKNGGAWAEAAGDAAGKAVGATAAAMDRMGREIAPGTPLGKSMWDAVQASGVKFAGGFGQYMSLLNKAQGGSGQVSNVTDLAAPMNVGGAAGSAVGAAGSSFMKEMSALGNQMATGGWAGASTGSAFGLDDDGEGDVEYHYHLHLSGPAAESKGVMRDFALLRAMAGSE